MNAGFGWNGIGAWARHSRAPIRIVLLLLLPVFVAGCLQMERVVRVNGNGSGVLIERFVLSNEIVGMMAGMQPEGKPLNVRDDAKLRGNAANFGPSVRFLSATDVVTDFGRGYEARYAFDNINTLRVGQNMDDSMPGDPAAGDGAQHEEAKFTTFTLRRTNPARLDIHWAVNEAGPESETEESAAEYSETSSTPEQEQMAMEMIKVAFKGMRVAMHVEVVGEIVETNAMHLEGTRVTLMDIDFGEMLADETALRAMADRKPESLADIKELMKLIPGLKMEIEPEIAILFR